MSECISALEHRKKETKKTSTHALELKVQWKCSCGLVLEKSYSQRNLSKFTALMSDGLSKEHIASYV